MAIDQCAIERQKRKFCSVARKLCSSAAIVETRVTNSRHSIDIALETVEANEAHAALTELLRTVANCWQPLSFWVGAASNSV